MQVFFFLIAAVLSRKILVKAKYQVGTPYRDKKKNLIGTSLVTINVMLLPEVCSVLQHLSNISDLSLKENVIFFQLQKYHASH